MSPILGSIGGASEYPFRGNLDDIPVNIILPNVSDLEPGNVGIATTAISGLNYQALVTVTNGAEFSVNAGTYDTLPKTIRNNQTLSVKFNTTSGSDRDFSKTYTTLVTVGRKKTNWSVITRAKDNTPNSFAFTSSTNQNVGILTSSNVITISGLDASLPSAFAFISSGIGSFSVNGTSGFTTSRVSVGDTIRLETYTPDSYSTTKVVAFTVGTFTTTFTVSTRVADTTTDPFTFTPLTDVDLNQTYTSNIVTLSGADNNVLLPSSISGSSGQYSVNSNPYISGESNVLNGNTVSVRIPSSVVVSYATTYRTTLNVSGVAGTFSVTTRPKPIVACPNQFRFTDLTTAAPEIFVESNVVTLEGMTEGDFGTAIISGGGGEFKVIRDNIVIREYSTTSTTVKNGDKIQLRLTAPSPLQNIQTTFTVSGQNTTTLPGFTQVVSDIWSVTSRDFICSPLTESNFFISPRFKDVEFAEIKTLYNTLVDFSSVYDIKCGFVISTSNPDSYIENPYTGEIDTEVSIPDIPSLGIKVWMKSSNAYNTLKETTITISNAKNPEASNILTKKWAILTRQEDKTPDTFYLSTRNISKANPNTTFSTYVTQSLSGLTNETVVPATVTSTNGTALISKNNGPFLTTLDNIKNGDRIDIKLTSSTLDQSVTATVTVGNLTETWLVSTINSVPVINFSISPATGGAEYQKTLVFQNTGSFGVDYKIEEISQTFPWNSPVKLSWLFQYQDSATLTLPYLSSDSQTFAIQNISDYTYNYASQATLNFAGQISSGIQPNPDGSTNLVFQIRAVNTTGISTSFIVAKSDPPPPSVFIQVTPTGTIPYEEDYTITWASVYAASVENSTNLSNTTSTSGSLVFNNSLESKTHSISVKNVTGIGTTSITVNVAACNRLFKETDYATFAQGILINSNGTESPRGYYLHKIKDNQNIVPYLNNTNPYSSARNTYKSVVTAIAYRFISILQRPPTYEEVEQWLATYNNGFTKRVDYNVTINPVNVDPRYSYTRIIAYLPGVSNVSSSGQYSGNPLIGAPYSIGFRDCFNNADSRFVSGDFIYEAGGSDGRYDDAILYFGEGVITYVPSRRPYEFATWVLPYSVLSYLTDKINTTLQVPTVLATKIIDRCRANISPIFLFTFSKVLSVYGETASGTDTYSGKTGVVNPGFIADIQSSYRFDKVVNNFILELKVDTTWAYQSGFVGLCNDVHWNAGPNYSSTTGERAMYQIGSNKFFGDRTGTTIQTFVSSLQTQGVFAPNDILGMVFNNSKGKLAIYKNGTLLVILTNSQLIASESAPLYPVVSYIQEDISLDSTILQEPSSYSSEYVFPV